MRNVVNQVIVLGGGMERQGDHIALSVDSNQRVDRYLEYWLANREACMAKEAKVICSGGYGLLAAGVEPPKDGSREAILMADCMVKAGVPVAKIEIEDESYSTITNWTESMRRGFIRPDSYDSANRLGVVTHSAHYKRAADSARRLGLTAEKLLPILVAKDTHVLREYGLRAMYTIVSLGAHDSESLISRENILQTVLRQVRPSKTL